MKVWKGFHSQSNSPGGLKPNFSDSVLVMFISVICPGKLNTNEA